MKAVELPLKKLQNVVFMRPIINQAKRERKPNNPGRQMVIKIPDKVTLLSRQKV